MNTTRTLRRPTGLSLPRTNHSDRTAVEGDGFAVTMVNDLSKLIESMKEEARRIRNCLGITNHSPRLDEQS